MLAVRDLENEHPIASDWRATLESIVVGFVNDDFELKNSLAGVKSPPQDIANKNRAYVKDYGEKLVPLTVEVWSSSRAQWMGTHWEIILDLCTESEGVSDLALHGKAYSSEKGIKFELGLIYVP